MKWETKYWRGHTFGPLTSKVESSAGSSKAGPKEKIKEDCEVPTLYSLGWTFTTQNWWITPSARMGIKDNVIYVVGTWPHQTAFCTKHTYIAYTNLSYRLRYPYEVNEGDSRFLALAKVLNMTYYEDLEVCCGSKEKENH